MDIAKAVKPIHIICPFCKHDLQYDGQKTLARRDAIGKRIYDINIRLGELSKIKRLPYSKVLEREQLKCEKDKLQKDLLKIKEDIHMMNQISEIRKNQIFNKKVKELIGEKEYARLREQCEEEYLDEDTYYFYDLAIQRFNNFSGC